MEGNKDSTNNFVGMHGEVCLFSNPEHRTRLYRPRQCRQNSIVKTLNFLQGHPQRWQPLVAQIPARPQEHIRPPTPKNAQIVHCQAGLRSKSLVHGHPQK